MKSEVLMALIDKFASDLGEHCDAVQILTSWNDNGVTSALYRGSGNWHARQGMAHEFINMDQCQNMAHELSNVIPRPDSPDGDEWKG